MLESSLLARIAERAQVPLRVARSALRRWHELSDEERAFLERFLELGKRDRGDVLECLPSNQPLPLIDRTVEEAS